MRGGRGEVATILASVIDALRKVADDEAMARILNPPGLRTAKGASWPKRRVSSVRRRHGIAAFCARPEAAAGWS